MSTKDRIESRVLPILRDPRSGLALRLQDGRFISETTTYPVVRGVPRFVDDDKYVASFSFEWNTHDTTQLDCVTGDKASEHEFVQKTGFGPSDLAGKLVLDAGVGAGRYADICSRWGADVVGVDLSYAVEASSRNFSDRSNVWIAQADIGALPFDSESFDVIFSIGVLHHTPDTQAYFRKLVPLLKPGGIIVIWVYPLEGDYITRERWIKFVNKIPARMFYHWCRWFVPWAEARLDSPIVGALRRVFPFPTHGRGMESDILDTFDGYSPRFHGIHSPEEVESWFKEAGLEDVRRPSNWNTCVRGQKPLNRNASSLTQHRVSIENEGATPVNLQPRDNSALSADVDYAIQVATYYLQHMDEMGTSLAKSQILELGPGINFGPQLILASHGAQVTLADRFLAPWDETYHPHFYRLLRSRWDGKSSVLDKVIDAGEYPIGSLTLLSEPAERLHSVANGTFDLVISNAVLEHVYDLPAVCQELARVTKIGGANSHQIDFRYHADFSQPLEFLLYAENDFRKKFAIEMGQIGNRWRPSEADALFRRHGFSITRIINNGFTEAHYLAGFIPRLRKSRSHYRKWPEKDLTVVSARYVLTRVQSYPLIFRGEVDFLTGQYRKLFWRFGG